MGKINLKTSGVIFLFAIILSIAAAGIFLWFGQTSSRAIEEINTSLGGIYPLTVEEAAIMQFNDEEEKNPLPDKEIISAEDFSSYYTAVIMKQLPFIIAVLCTIIIIFSIALWQILSYLQRKSNLKLVQNLNTITEEKKYADVEPYFSEIYQKLKHRFDHHITDYKRLNSYLSHEQKNAMAILRARLELVQDEHNLKLVDQLTESIDDILTLSESDASEVAGSVDAALICAEVCDAYRSVYKQIYFHFDEGKEYYINAKERWIYRAVSNLVDNAVKYGQNNPVHVELQNKNGSIIVVVKDKGIGMDERAGEEIFQHYYRIGKLQNDGYGIGLSLVSHVCNLCGGFIYAESQKNQGSAFYLSFPRSDLAVNIQ